MNKHLFFFLLAQDLILWYKASISLDYSPFLNLVGLFNVDREGSFWVDQLCKHDFDVSVAIDAEGLN